ncbi:hypothetical protein [Acetobacter malorum]|uniref:hypothetical protein n=1 Tax=Acetobacter malorum TaxID=178901 RepID=UPI000A937270|nr:hypothetical protein [Acetobacter malorum]
MLVYENYLTFQGNDAESIAFKAVGVWLKEQLGFGLHPQQLKQSGKFNGSRTNHKTHKEVNSWLKIYAATDGVLQIFSWILKNEDENTFGRQWVTELGLKCNGSYIEFSCVVRTEENSTLVTTAVAASQPRVIRYLTRNVENSSKTSFTPQVEGIEEKK